jgi:hypothetical protein
MQTVAPMKIRSIVRKPAQPVYDIQVKKNHNFFANNLLVHNCIIFQEQVMELAEKVAGFPKDKCDEVRRAIMKLVGAAAEKAKKEIRDPFIQGAITNGYTEAVASNLFDKILYFAGYGFNKSHAVAYAIDSFWCSWLLTYYEEQWLCAYMESMSHTPIHRAKAFGEARSLGYQIVPIDINHATVSWTILPGKRMMPSMTTVKGIGEAAVEEIVANRPFSDLEALLYAEDGSWRPSKLNRKAMEALIKIRAFDSLNCVGDDRLFGSYRHMYEVMMGSYTEEVPRRKGSTEMVERVRDHGAMIKRSPTKDRHEGRKNLYGLARGLRDDFSEEWTQRELAGFQSELFGTADVTTMFDPEIFGRMDNKGVGSIEDLELGETDVVWFVTVLATVKKGGEPVAGLKKRSKAGKDYVQVFVTGPIGKPIRLSVWTAKELLEPFRLYVAEVKKDDFGVSTGLWKVKLIA